MFLCFDCYSVLEYFRMLVLDIQCTKCFAYTVYHVFFKVLSKYNIKITCVHYAIHFKIVYFEKSVYLN